MDQDRPRQHHDIGGAPTFMCRPVDTEPHALTDFDREVEALRQVLGLPGACGARSARASGRVAHGAAGGQRVRVVDSTADDRWMVLPRRPEGTEGWGKERLAALLDAGDLIGVTVPTAGGRAGP